MLVHRRVTPSIKFAGTHLYTWVERGIVRVKCYAQEHNTMSPARPRTRTTRSGVERTNHEATAPPTGRQAGNKALNLFFMMVGFSIIMWLWLCCHLIISASSFVHLVVVFQFLLLSVWEGDLSSHLLFYQHLYVC